MRKISEILEKLMRSDPRFSRIDEFRVVSVWKDIVGDLISSRARPVNFENSILFVECDDPMWVNELNLMKGRIISKINEKLGEGRVKDIVIRRGWGWRGTRRRT